MKAKKPKKKSLKKQTTKTTSLNKDRATDYSLAVVSGEIIAGPYVRGSCQRHLDDLKTADERGFYYDEQSAAEAIDFFEICLCLWGAKQRRVVQWFKVQAMLID